MFNLKTHIGFQVLLEGVVIRQSILDLQRLEEKRYHILSSRDAMTRPTTNLSEHEEDSKRHTRTGEDSSKRRMRTGVRGGPVEGEQEEGGRQHHLIFPRNQKTEAQNPKLNFLLNRLARQFMGSVFGKMTGVVQHRTE